MPGIEALKLERLQYITPGIDVQEIDLPDILSEIKQLKTWVDQNVKDEVIKQHIFTRAKLLEKKLPIAFQRKDAVVFIG